jgi:hypothetical protein
MMWKKNTRAGLAVLAFALVVVGCSDSQSHDVLAPGLAKNDDIASATIYDQVEFLGNPLVSEVTIVKANHDGYNRTQPYNSATYRPQTEAFITSFGRPQGLATTLGSVLYPDILIVDASKDPSTAGWLSWALAGGWGGRKPTDDVVDLALTAVFSSFLDPTNAVCAPFQLPLCTDNVGSNDSAFLSTFPYLAPRHTAE